MIKELLVNHHIVMTDLNGTKKFSKGKSVVVRLTAAAGLLITALTIIWQHISTQFDGSQHLLIQSKSSVKL